MNGGEDVQIDPQLLFQRLITVVQSSSELKAYFLKYELCSYPPALFDSSLLLREARKPVLADAIWDLIGTDAEANIIPNGT